METTKQKSGDHYLTQWMKVLTCYEGGSRPCLVLLLRLPSWRRMTSRSKGKLKPKLQVCVYTSRGIADRYSGFLHVWVTEIT